MQPSRDVLLALIPFAGFALVYGLTACPTFSGGDSAELAAAAATFGVPHPPGYPTFTMATGLVGRALAAAGLAADFGGATAIASGLYAAGALALFTLVLREIELSVAAALAAAVALGVGRTLWSQAVVTEVYTFDLLLGLAAALALARGSRAAGWAGWAGPLLAGALGGLWLGHRFVNVLYLPVGLALLPPGGVGAALKRTWKLLLGGAAAAALVFLYLPVASARDPAIDVGDPSTLARFLVVVRGAPYMRHMTGGGWQLGRFGAGLPRELGPLALLAPVGLLGAWRRRRRLGRPHPPVGDDRLHIGARRGRSRLAEIPTKKRPPQRLGIGPHRIEQEVNKDPDRHGHPAFAGPPSPGCEQHNRHHHGGENKAVGDETHRP